MNELSYDQASVNMETGLTHPAKPSFDIAYSSTSSSSSSTFDPPSLPSVQSVAVTQQPRKGYRNCWGCWPHWKPLPTGFILLLVGIGLVAILGITSWFLVPHLTAKDCIKKERLAKIDAENAIHQRASIMALPGDYSEVSLSTATPFPFMTVPIHVFTDPAQTTVLTKTRVAMSTDSVAFPAPSMGVTRNPSDTFNTLSDQSTRERLLRASSLDIAL
ncbi:unnamed protein product [Penicillium glandicola]